MDDQDYNRFPVRKNPRMKRIDYASVNYYFVTICTQDKKCIFGKSGQPNVFGQVAEQGLCNINSHFPGTRIDKYVIMPNHVHAIVVIEQQGTNLSVLIGQYKSFVSREIHKIRPDLKVWQPSFHDHVIRNQKAYEQIWMYIDANPANWGEDCFYTDKDEKPTASAGS